MPAIITSLHFNSDHFPLSPHMQEFAIRNEFLRVVIAAVGPEEHFKNFQVLLDEPEYGHALNVPDGTYAMLINKRGTDVRPEIVMSLLHEQSQKIVADLMLDQAAFVHEFELAAAIAPPLDELHNFDGRDFEVEWSSNYLKTLFSSQIEGSDQFWRKLNGGLDMALIPINLKMAMTQLPPEERKPIEVVFAYDPKFQAK